MARPKVFDYDATSDETVVTEGVEGAKLTWIGINPLTQDVNGQTREPFAHLLFTEGTLNQAGDDLETITRGPTQVNIEGQAFTDWYTANKALFDDLVRICFEKAAELKSKTGSVVES